MSSNSLLPEGGSSKIDKATLTIGSLLGEGGFGKVYRVRTQDNSEPLAYKEFRNPTQEQIENLEQLVAFRLELSPGERAELDSFALWPRAIVTSNDQSVGYLMEVLPDRFVEQAIVQTKGTSAVPRSLDWLARRDHARRNGASLVVEPDDVATRSTFAALIAFAFAFLHRHRIVFGDVSMANILHADNPPEIRLIDLDTARIVGRSPEFPQPHTVGLLPPECKAGQQEQTIETDRFKMAAMFFYILSSTVQMTGNSAPLVGKVDDAGMTLFRHALNRDPASRPAAADWYRNLYGRVAALAKLPEVTDFQASQLQGVQGETIELTWTIEGHTSLVLEMPTGERRNIGVSASNSLEVQLKETGRYRLIAENHLGTVIAETPIVKMFVPPEVRFVDVPAFSTVGNHSLGLSDNDIQAMLTSGDETESIKRVVSSALPRASLPLDFVGDVLTPSLSRKALDWSGLNNMVDDAFAGPREESQLQRRIGLFRNRFNL